MKVVVLDGGILNPGDLSWDALQELGDVEIFETTKPDQVISRSSSAEILLVNKIVLRKEEMESLPNLRYIGETATGYDNIDVEYAKKRGIVVTNVPSYGTNFVAQHTMALLLELTNHVGLHDHAVRCGEWSKSPVFSFWKTPLFELHGLKMGIIGYGAIGEAVAKLARAFGMKILTTSARKKEGATQVDQETLFRESDVVSLHCKYTEKTKHIINEETLSLMKPSAILLNASRGPLIDENALASALKNKQIQAAALDVLEKEPPSSSPLIGIENCIITPHIAWASKEARGRLLHIVVENIKAYLQKEPLNQL